MDGVVLFSDDHIFSSGRPESKLFKLLREDLPVLGVNNLELAQSAVSSIGSFKAIILDWQYGDEDIFEEVAEELGQSKVIESPSTKQDAAFNFLKNNNFYSLIYIFSEKDIEELYGPKLREKFGKRIRIKRKDKFENDSVGNYKDEILEEIDKWQDENENLSIPIKWSISINESIQKIFKELSEADTNWIKDIYDSAKGDGTDPELFVIDLLQLVLSESLVQEKGLIDSINKIGATELPEIDDLEMHSKSLSKLFSRLYYSELKEDAPIMTGDICEIDEENYGVIITPECDVRYVKGEEEAEYELLCFTIDSFENYLKRYNYDKLNDNYLDVGNNKKEKLRKIFNQDESKLHFLPSIPLINDDFNYTSVINFRSGHKRIISGDLNELNRKYKLNSPFIQQLRQRYLSYKGRIGTPALPSHVRDWNLS
jgi:hypothetical protein